MTTPTHKECHGVLLPVSAFAANKTKADGLQPYCRDCQKAMRAEWAAKNKERTQAYDRQYRASKRGASKPRALATIPIAASATPAEAPVPASSALEGNIAMLDHAAIVSSLGNPRKHFDHDFIQGLAADFKAQGWVPAIVVRPLPGSRVAETYTDRRADAPRPTHEIIAGEQRWRACEIAGIRQIPVLIRNASDDEVLRLQLLENLKRRDLHPLEEAEGYQRWRDTAGVSAEEIADDIGMKRSYVYKTLKLLDLEPECREAFFANKLTRSTAELVAMRPPNLQIPLLKEITATDFHGEGMSFRKAKAHVEERYMLRLGAAPFQITDETLVPEVGSCRTCPRRTGASPELFDDISHADTCTDPTCFAGKKEAHYARVRAEAEKKGQTVIVGREAKEIMPDGVTLRGYTRVDDHQALGGQMRTLRKVLGKDMPEPTLIENPKTREMVAVLPTAVVGKLLKDQGIAKSPTVATNETEEKRHGVEQFEKAWRLRAIESIDKQLGEDMVGGFNAPVLRCVALLLLDGLSNDQRKHTCKLLGLGSIAPREAIAAHIRECEEEHVERALYLLLVQHDMSDVLPAGTDKAAPSERLAAVAQDFAVDLEVIKAEVKKEFKEAASAKRVDAAAQAVKSTHPSKPGAKPKKSKAEAAAEIAQALQAIEGKGEKE